MPIVLRALVDADEEPARLAHEELARENFEFLLDLKEGEDWARYVGRVNRMAAGLDVPEGWVPTTFLVAEVDGELVGRISIRHELNDYLRQVAGHVGYGVRQAFRRRGYATAMLRHGLVVAQSVGIERVLVTCDRHNVASATVIERCGGVLEDDAPRREGTPAKLRYWITPSP